MHQKLHLFSFFLHEIKSRTQITHRKFKFDNVYGYKDIHVQKIKSKKKKKEEIPGSFYSLTQFPSWYVCYKSSLVISDLFWLVKNVFINLPFQTAVGQLDYAPTRRVLPSTFTVVSRLQASQYKVCDMISNQVKSFKVRLWVLMRDQTLTHLSADISLIP